MRGKLRASPSFADMISTSLCPPRFHLFPQSPFTPYSQAPSGPLDLMGATVQPCLMQGGRSLSGHGVGVRGWSLIQETGTLLHHPKALWAQQVLQSPGSHKWLLSAGPHPAPGGHGCALGIPAPLAALTPRTSLPLEPPGHVCPLPMAILVPSSMGNPCTMDVPSSLTFPAPTDVPAPRTSPPVEV